MRAFFIVAIATLGLSAQTTPAAKPPAAKPAKPAANPAPPVPSEPGLYATIRTSAGDIICKLFEKETPMTVKNFTDLAQGRKTWTDPKTGAKKSTPLYSGTIFHRTIPNFMIQGGDPLGNGMGTPGYQFKDEIVPSLKFDKPGLLAMANAGPNTNGSQFFITVVPTPHLNGKHTIFGEVVQGQDVVNKIVGMPLKSDGESPVNPVKINRIMITRVGAPPAAAAKPTAGAKPASAKPKPKPAPAAKP